MRDRKRRIGRRPILNLKTQTLIPSEYQECKTFYQYAVRKGFHEDLVKNANERMGDQGWFIKALIAIGMRKGWPDYHYFVANNKYHGLWLEFKRIDERGKPTPAAQDACIERLKMRGHYACYVYGCDEAIRIFTAYINNEL